VSIARGALEVAVPRTPIRERQKARPRDALGRPARARRCGHPSDLPDGLSACARVRRRLHRDRPCLQSTPRHRSSPKKVGQRNNLFGLANFLAGACPRHALERVDSLQIAELSVNWDEAERPPARGARRRR